MIIGDLGHWIILLGQELKLIQSSLITIEVKKLKNSKTLFQQLLIVTHQESVSARDCSVTLC